MKEFLIEDFIIENNNSVRIEYYFYSEFSIITFTEEQIKDVFNTNSNNSWEEWLREEFEVKDCITLLKHYIREYKER